jgi:hypothetical protein
MKANRATASGLLATWLLLVASATPGDAHRSSRLQSRALTVGWHDEFNTLEGWSPWTANGGADILSGMDGTLRVTLGKTAMYMPVFKDYRAGVWKEFEIDLNRYTTLAVRANHFRNGRSWDAQVLEYRDPKAPDVRDISTHGGIAVPGNPEKLAVDEVASTGNRYSAETVFVFIPPILKRTGKSRVRVLLNLSGPTQGASVDFAWIRLLTVEQGRLLREHPNSQRWTITAE